MEHKNNFLVMMILIAFAIGLLVMIVNPDYRFNKIIESNKNYSPSVKVESIQD